jgi:RNA polymerase sigma-70 factor (ECF subfamily)
MSSIGNRRDEERSIGNGRSELPGARPDGGPQTEPRRATPTAEFAQQIIGEIPFLRRTVRRWHRQKPDADDLVQETLMQALANAHLWQPGSNLRAWLFTIMHHQFLAAIAKSKRAAALLQVCDPNGRAAAEDSRETRLVLRDVGAVLRRLPTKQRTALQLVGVEGRSYEEVAVAMGLSVGAVRCHLARGRGRLRAAVGSGDASPWTARRAQLPPERRPVFAARSAVFAMAMGD